MLIQSSACKKVLLLAGDTTSRMINKKDRTVSMVFGDAASATIIEKGKNKMGCIIYSDGSGAKDLIVPAGAFRIPANNDTAEEKEFEGKIFRSQNDLFMDGMQIMSFSLLRVPPLIKESVEMMNWEVDNVDQYLFHQANDFMVGYLRKKLKLPETKVPMAVTEYGNTGPSSIPLTISDKFYSKELNLHRVIMCGFGVGLSWGSICTNLNQTNIYKPYIFNQHEY
jgi:3-oxoacyl-[acyl-carrier-protein] synthase III